MQTPLFLRTRRQPFSAIFHLRTMETDTEEEFGKDERSAWSQKRLNSPHHEVKTKPMDNAPPLKNTVMKMMNHCYKTVQVTKFPRHVVVLISRWFEILQTAVTGHGFDGRVSISGRASVVSSTSRSEGIWAQPGTYVTATIGLYWSLWLAQRFIIREATHSFPHMSSLCDV
jgi:hypothetical protein